MGGIPAPDIQIQTQKSSEKESKSSRYLASPTKELCLQIHPENPFIFEPAPGAAKIRKNWSSGSQHTRKVNPGIIENDFCEKLFVAIP